MTLNPLTAVGHQCGPKCLEFHSKRAKLVTKLCENHVTEMTMIQLTESQILYPSNDLRQKVS